MSLQGGNQVGQKAYQVVITFINREPGEWLATLLDLLTDQRCFAKTGRGGDERELVAVLKPLVEGIDELRTLDKIRPQ